MNTAQVADTLGKKITDSTAGQPKGKQESHDLASLSVRLGIPIDAVVKLLGTGVLRPLGAVNSKHDDGFYVFASDDLNDVRKSAAQAIVEKVIEETDGDPTQVTMAASHALDGRREATAKKTGKQAFSAIPAGLVTLQRYCAPEEEPSTIAKIGKAAAVVGAGAAAVGGAAWLRGRIATGANRAGALGVMKTGALGLRKLKQDAVAGVGAVKAAFAPRPGTVPPAADPAQQKRRPGYFSARDHQRLVQLNARVTSYLARPAA